MRLEALVLRVADVDAQVAFYIDRLGMSRVGERQVRYDAAGAAIEFQQATIIGGSAPTPDDRYWKVGITLPNVDLAAAQLRASGIEVSAPEQFRDVGYLCHLQDPEGFTIELLQHDFGAPPRGLGDPDAPLGGGARLGQITLRVVDLEAALACYRDRLGMRLLSVQPVEEHGFTLYFLAFTDEQPPDPELTAVANRPWLWRRSYTCLELQHWYRERRPVLRLPAAGAAGFARLEVGGAPDAAERRDEAGGSVRSRA